MILMNKAENMLLSKSLRRRRKFIDLIKKHSDVSVNYQFKNNWIEKFIEQEFKYLDDKNDNVEMMVVKLLKKTYKQNKHRKCCQEVK